jgi:hypothetical protein
VWFYFRKCWTTLSLRNICYTYFGIFSCWHLFMKCQIPPKFGRPTAFLFPEKYSRSLHHRKCLLSLVGDALITILKPIQQPFLQTQKQQLVRRSYSFWMTDFILLLLDFKPYSNSIYTNQMGSSWSTAKSTLFIEGRGVPILVVVECIFGLFLFEVPFVVMRTWFICSPAGMSHFVFAYVFTWVL